MPSLLSKSPIKSFLLIGFIAASVLVVGSSLIHLYFDRLDYHNTASANIRPYREFAKTKTYLKHIDKVPGF